MPDLRITHFSAQFSDDRDQMAADVEWVFATHPAIVTGTEASRSRGGRRLRRVLRMEAAKANYWLHLPRSADTWVALDRDVFPQSPKRGHIHVIDGRAGHYSAKGITWAGGYVPRLGCEVFAASFHKLTKGRSRTGAGRHLVTRWWANRRYAKAMGKWAVARGAGDDLVFVNGDANEHDRRVDIFAGGPLTTCWDEVKHWPGTHDGSRTTMDVIASYDRDGRVSCERAWVVRAPDLNSDHDPITAIYRIAPKETA